MEQNRPDIRGFTHEELKEELKNINEKPFRADQIYTWLHQKGVTSFDQMTNLSLKLRDTLKETYEIYPVEMVEKLESKLDGTAKYLFRLRDGHVIESVLMRYHHGNSVCISSQVGCRMGCKFCASTLLGLARNMTSGEMAGQIYAIEADTGERVSNIVVMGTGEPMDNYQEFLRFVKNISSEKGLHISQRNLTVSTCGLVDRIRELAEEKLSVTLAISLHAPNDELRKTIMPVANRYTIKEIMEACDFYFQETGRRITFEYSLMKGVNDTEEHAKELAQLLKGKNCHVNLIPVNPVKERSFQRTEDTDVERFKKILEKYRTNVTIRRRMGADIDAACGQLRLKYENPGKRN